MVLTSKRYRDKDGYFTHTYQDGKYVGRKAWSPNSTNFNNEEIILIRKTKREPEKEVYYIKPEQREYLKPERTYSLAKEYQFVYVCKGGPKDHIFTVSRPFFVNMPVNSRMRYELYDDIIEKYQEYDLTYDDLELMMTYDRITGDRVKGGFN
jgi:hypothetical protein